jgi:iron complex transport system ATP-binding protein
MIQLKNLSVGYGDTAVLAGVSLDFPTEAVTILIGPNGCGKSTLMRSALGLQPILSGSVLYDGTPITSLSAREIAQQAAYLAQSRNTPNITGYRMVLHGRFPYLSYPRRYRQEDHEAVRRALAAVDAQDLSQRQLSTLSGGQRQKIYLAMALAQDTETIFLDEPTTYLDIRHQLEVMEIAKRLASQGKAVVLVLHDLCMALRTGDRIAVFSEGRLQQLGRPQEVYESGILTKVFGTKVGRVETEDGVRYYYI